MQIWCIGDSLTRGFGVLRGKDYPSQLAEVLGSQGLQATVHNCGIDGQDTEELLGLLAKQLEDGLNGDLVLLLIGSNDAFGLRRSVERFEVNLNMLVQAIQSRGFRLLMATLPPIEMDVLYIEDPNRRLTEYNAVIRRLAQSENLQVVELAALDVNLTTDGVHFGERGYREMALLWAKGVLDNF